jgi:hypothetical protein
VGRIVRGSGSETKRAREEWKRRFFFDVDDAGERRGLQSGRVFGDPRGEGFIGDRER